MKRHGIGVFWVGLGSGQFVPEVLQKLALMTACLPIGILAYA